MCLVLKIIFSSIVLLFSLSAFAQTSTPGQEKAGEIVEDLVKEELPDQLLKVDSINPAKVVADTLKQTGKQMLQDSLRSKQSLFNFPDVKDVKIDSTTAGKVKEQAIAIATDTLRNQEFIKDEYLNGVDELKSLRDVPQDSLGSHLEKELSEKGEQYLKNTDEYKAISELGEGEGLGELQDYKDKLEQAQKEMMEAAAKNELKAKLSTQGKQFASEHLQQIQQVQDQMGDLKKKYSSVANSEDMSSAVKRTSLEGEPVWKRLVLGGNFNITKTNPLNIDLSPVIGYRFNKLFEAGITAAYRTQLKASNYHITQHKEDVYGFSVFASHMVFKNFFGYAEAESLKKSEKTAETSFSNWRQTLLLGIGRRFHLTSWLDMQTMVLVNLLHDNKDGLYNSPVILKTGFRKRN